MDQADNNGVTALHYVADKGHLPVVKYLVAEGKANVHLADGDGSTALHVAADNGRLPVIKYLVTEGKAHVNHADNDGVTALWWAARQGHAPVVKFLATEGKATDDDVKAALDRAASGATEEKDLVVRNALTEVVKVLVESKATVDTHIWSLVLQIKVDNKLPV